MKVKDSVEIERKISLNIPKRTITHIKREENKLSIEQKDDFISSEEPFEISVKTVDSIAPPQNIAVTMRTKGMDKELSAGFLFTEGLIEKMSDIIDVENLEHKVIITLAKEFKDKLNKINRNFFTSSSCGICSKSSASSIFTQTSYLPFASELKVTSESLFDTMEHFKEENSIFQRTGGIHSCVLLDSEMNKIGFFEDVGRHNAMDKLIGWTLINDIFPLNNYIVLLSGRISFELVQKASMAGISMLCALGAPTTMAIDEAYAQSMSLVGFSKNNSYNVYCGLERIINK